MTTSRRGVVTRSGDPDGLALVESRRAHELVERAAVTGRVVFTLHDGRQQQKRKRRRT